MWWPTAIRSKDLDAAGATWLDRSPMGGKLPEEFEPRAGTMQKLIHRLSNGPARFIPDYFPNTSKVKVLGTIGGLGRGWAAVGAGAVPNSAVTKYTRWVLTSSAMVRAPRWV